MNLAQQAITSHIIDRYIADYAIKMSQAKREERFRATARPYEAKYRKMLRESFSMQMDEVLFTLQWYKSKGIEDNIDWNKYRIIYNEFGQLTIPEAMQEWGNTELEALELGISLDVENPYVREAIFNRSNLFADTVVNKTRDWLHVVIANNINLGPYGLEKKIRQLYPQMSKYRSTRIARTETIWDLNEGAERSYIQSGVVAEKQWLTALDERTCPFCMHMNGKHIPVGTNFFNLGESLTVPNPKGLIFIQTKSGGYTFEISLKAREFLTFSFKYENVSHPGLHPHCRCTIIPIVAEGGKMYMIIYGKWFRIA